MSAKEKYSSQPRLEVNKPAQSPSLVCLEEELARIVNLLRFASKLPDKGQKLKDKVANLKAQIAEAKENDKENESVKEKKKGNDKGNEKEEEKGKERIFRKAPDASTPASTWGRNATTLGRISYYSPVRSQNYKPYQNASMTKFAAGSKYNSECLDIDEISFKLEQLCKLESGTCPEFGSSRIKINNIKNDCRLKYHQEKGLHWLHDKENSSDEGGILGDEMGLGKTLTLLSLIALSDNSGKCELCQKSCKLVSAPAFDRPSLVICPTSVMHEWKSQTMKFTKFNVNDEKNSDVYLYHGTSRVKDKEALKKKKIVVTSYGIARSEHKAFLKEPKETAISGLYGVDFCRIILDEGHTIREKDTAIAKAVCALNSSFRWVVTGTPYQNKIGDLQSYFKFLRIEPLSKDEFWKSKLRDPEVFFRVVHRTLSGILLRRLKGKQPTTPLCSDTKIKKRTSDMPPKTIMFHKVDLGISERKMYDDLRRAIKSRSSYFKTNECPLTSLQKLHRIANGIELSQFDEESGDISEIQNLMTGLSLSRGSHSATAARRKATVVETPGIVSEKSKFKAAIQTLCFILKKSERAFQGSFQFNKKHYMRENFRSETNRIVVLSQWTTSLDALIPFLDLNGIQWKRIDGNIPLCHRGDILSHFDGSRSSMSVSENYDVQVLLATIGTCNSGINLTSCNHLFLLEPNWNPMIEAQAMDRIHRIGQKKRCFIHKFVAKNSIEECIVQLQKRKIAEAESILDIEKGRSTSISYSELLNLL
eukprot:Nk52_evm42s343 gene=Nk52_evmTU42s343